MVSSIDKASCDRGTYIILRERIESERDPSCLLKGFRFRSLCFDVFWVEELPPDLELVYRNTEVCHPGFQFTFFSRPTTPPQSMVSFGSQQTSLCGRFVEGRHGHLHRSHTGQSSLAPRDGVTVTQEHPRTRYLPPQGCFDQPQMCPP